MNSATINNTHHRKRLAAEKRFRLYGQCALGLAVAILAILVGGIVLRGWRGFEQTQIKLTITYDAALLGVDSREHLRLTPYHYELLAQAALKRMFPDAATHEDQHALDNLLSEDDGDIIKPVFEGHPAIESAELWLPASSNADMYIKGNISEKTPEADRKLSDRQIGWLKTLEAKGDVRTVFNRTFFTAGDSRLPEQAGFLGAIMGSAFTLIVCLLVVFPLGVATAVYLEEFARKGRFVTLVEININNLAAVPSIVFGLLGLAVYINVMGLPRSASLVGGLTLAMMILPVIIITTRVALASIPGSIRDAARALGASPLQVVWHHALPLAMPGIMTGTILGMARAIGETAPLLMIGMVAFVADVPTGFTSPATVMPVQIYLWAGSPETGFAEKTAAGILLLLMLLMAMNALAIVLRRRFEVRW